jgi:hypothetical protein
MYDPALFEDGVRAFIELPTLNWAEKQKALAQSLDDGYHVEEIRGDGTVWLWLTGSPVRAVPMPPAAKPPPGSREPVLARAHPADAVPGSSIDADVDVEVELQDGTWVPGWVTVQRRDRHGRWCVGVQWHASTEIAGRYGVFLYDPAHIKRARLERAARREGAARMAVFTSAGSLLSS